MKEYITKEQAWYIISYAANTGNLEQAKKLLDVAPNKGKMTNYEKHKEEVVDSALDDPVFCLTVLRLRTNNKCAKCPGEGQPPKIGRNICDECEAKSKVWLLQECE